MIFEIIFVVELFTTFWTEMFVVCSLLVNIPQVFDQIFPEKKFLVTDTTRDIKVALGSMLFPHVTIQLAPVSEADRGVVEVAHDAPVPDLRTWTVVGLETFVLTEEFHADRTVGDLLIGVPGTQVGEQVVLLIKIQGADKALELGPLLVESLHVSQ